MAGCAKAGRMKKSKGNMKYVAGKVDLVNKGKKAKRVLKNQESKATRSPKVAKGTARALRRWQTGVTKLNQTSSLLSKAQMGKATRHIRPATPKVVDRTATIMLNGELMSPAKAAVVARRLMAERRAERSAVLPQSEASPT